MKQKNRITTVRIDGNTLTTDLLNKIACDTEGKYKITISPKALKKMQSSSAYIDAIVRNVNTNNQSTPYIYGVNTGFGANKHKFIGNNESEQIERMAKLTYNLIINHATGVGEKFPREIVRAAMILRVNTLAKGYSGIRPEVADKLVAMINSDVTPVVPNQGSVGGSGDLAPLSHIALVFALNPEGNNSYLPYGKVEIKDDRGGYKIVDAEQGMKNIGGIVLRAKEGLALNNGTQFLTALCATALTLAEKIHRQMIDISVMTLEAVHGTKDSLDPFIHSVRNLKGQCYVASEMLEKLTGSGYVFDPTNKADYTLYRRDIELQMLEKELGLREKITPIKEPIQDVYSVRCTPQVLGAVMDTISFVNYIVECEVNSANDNPLINVDFDESKRLSGKAISGGNFHGEPIAMAADFLKIAVAEMGSLSERRIALLLDANLNKGLPAFLIDAESIHEDGMHSGFMMSQYVAAALVAENKILSHPASVDSIPTSNNTEDHVSMGTHGARFALQVAENVVKVIAIELLCAAQAIYLRKNFSLMDRYAIQKRLTALEAKKFEIQESSLTEEEKHKNIEKAQKLENGLKFLEKIVKEYSPSYKCSKHSDKILRKLHSLLSEHKLTFPLYKDVHMKPYLDVVADAVKKGYFLS